jgi:diadenylate cyclase
MQELTAAIVATFAHFDLRSFIDILVVAFLLYWLLVLLRGTTAISLLRALVAVYLLGLLASAAFQLTVVSWLLRNSLPALLVAMPILFQPELRRVLERIGRGVGPWRAGAPGETLVSTIDAVSQAGRILAQRRVGALIVLERETGLQDYIEQGVKIDALLSPELLVGLFHTGSPFHDGAAVVRRGRIIASRCVMPLSDNVGEHMALGMRHRAALGISERTDAIAVAVSEERGTVTIAANGRLAILVDVDRLREVLFGYFNYKNGANPQVVSQAEER